MSEKPAKKSRFSRPFKIFLFIALPLVAVAGVLTWAINSGIPDECERTDQRGAPTWICDRLYKKDHFEGKDVRDIPVPYTDTRAKTVYNSSISGLNIQVTNHTEQEYFVPFRTQKELASFAQWATTEGQGKDKVSICVKDKAVTDTTDIEGGEIIDGEYEYNAKVKGCGVEGRACTVTKIRSRWCELVARIPSETKEIATSFVPCNDEMADSPSLVRA